MSRHTAPEELLLDYAAGALAEGPALAVSLHVALDPAARRAVDRLGALGGALLEAEADIALDDTELARAMASIDRVAVEPRPVAAPLSGEFAWAPRPLHRYLHGAGGWRRKFGGFDEMRLSMAADAHRVSLLRLAPGHGLPMHRHRGVEFTVFLQGGFTDETGNYGPGDFAVGPGDEHRPIADPGEPCIALIVLDNPIMLTGPVGRLLNLLVRRGYI